MDVRDMFGCSLDYIISGENAFSSDSQLPLGIVEILKSDKDKQFKLLQEYLNMFLKLRSFDDEDQDTSD